MIPRERFIIEGVSVDRRLLADLDLASECILDPQEVPHFAKNDGSPTEVHIFEAEPATRNGQTRVGFIPGDEFEEQLFIQRVREQVRERVVERYVGRSINSRLLQEMAEDLAGCIQLVSEATCSRHNRPEISPTVVQRVPEGEITVRVRATFPSGRRA